MVLWPLQILNSLSAGTVFRRQILTSKDVRFCRLKTVPSLVNFILFHCNGTKKSEDNLNSIFLLNLQLSQTIEIIRLKNFNSNLPRFGMYWIVMLERQAG